MLIKEYKIPMPLSVDEYRIAQLYMIQKKSREESQGTESGVEIIENQPYTDGPGGNGQYTHKIYHISKHIPGWIVSILPKNALIVVEEGWNAYPYTRTRYTCPFVEKFSIDIETKYLNDVGETNNIFDLSPAEMRTRIVDEIDIVKEQVSDYKKEEDPRYYRSKKTGRGPLNEDWLPTMKRTPASSRGRVMCAYKRCKVEFKYWGMQSKIEKFIHDTGLRKVMLRAHKQAWCWQDEWFGLTMEDIRRLETETQMALRLKFVTEEETDEAGLESLDGFVEETKSETPTLQNFQQNSSNSDDNLVRNGSTRTFCANGGRGKPFFTRKTSTGSMLSIRNKPFERSSSQLNFVDARLEGIRRYSTDDSSDDDEFFDANDQLPETSLPALRNLAKYRPWGSSIENLAENHSNNDVYERETKNMENQISIESDVLDQVVTSDPTPCKIDIVFLILHGGNGLESSQQGLRSTKQSDLNTLQTTFESVINAHYKAAMGRIAMRLVACPQVCNEAYQLLQNLSPFGHDNDMEQTLSSSMISLFATSSSTYLDMVHSLATSCNLVYNSFLESAVGKGFQGQVCIISDTVGSILGYDMLCQSVMRRSSSSYSTSSRRGSSLSNHEEEDEEESISSVPGSPSLRVFPPQRQEQRKRRSSASPTLSSNSILFEASQTSVNLARNTLLPTLPPQRRASVHCGQEIIQRSSSYSGMTAAASTALHAQANLVKLETKLDFEVAEFFMLGSPLGLVLAMRQLKSGNDALMKSDESVQISPSQPACRHIYNLFYTADPSSARIEPLLDMRLSSFPPTRVVKYQMFPLGDGQSLSVGDMLTSGTDLFNDLSRRSTRRGSEWSVASGIVDQQVSGNLLQGATMHEKALNVGDDADVFKSDMESTNDVNIKVANRWWGEKRIDYALFCPEALSEFPTSSLPHLFHTSFWESTDVAAFVLRQVVKHDHVHVRMNDGKANALFTPALPREKWQRKRTAVKLRNLTSNHRMRDGVALENHPQIVSGRFMYGPLDMVTMASEKVDVYVMTQPPASEWVLVATEMTNSHGRITCVIPDERKLGVGIYPVKMVVRGDHTSADGYLAVLPTDVECVIFSVDGSFTASVSIMGADPKVRPGAVDVVRYWQDLGYLILYVTARPDMQKQKVVTWLAQHNFPHGLIWFGDGLSHDPLKQKTILLRNMQTDYKMRYAAAYGSSKDISVYSQLGVSQEKIFIVGKTSKKQSQQCCCLHDGYSSHLTDLMSASAVTAANFNAQLILPKGSFGLPGHSVTRKQRHSMSKKIRAVSLRTQGQSYE
ncbi:unnamed protein product [Clavelina lepadiformis]|uniref:DDHD domain-containing protein n=1 Tax=Clavelina lepadiformis TaxID=159417 RepID=A0ABP0FNC6_CLALP